VLSISEIRIGPRSERNPTAVDEPARDEAAVDELSDDEAAGTDGFVPIDPALPLVGRAHHAEPLAAPATRRIGRPSHRPRRFSFPG
jgi:hypothetical protein